MEKLSEFMVFATGDPIFEQKFVYKDWEFRLFCEYEKDYGFGAMNEQNGLCWWIYCLGS